MIVIYTLKENAGKPHISSWHALFGLLAMILTLIQLIGGLPLVYSWVRITGSNIIDLQNANPNINIISERGGIAHPEKLGKVRPKTQRVFSSSIIFIQKALRLINVKRWYLSP